MTIFSFLCTVLLVLAYISIPLHVQCINVPILDDMMHVQNAITNMRHILQLSSTTGTTPILPSTAAAMTSSSSSSAPGTTTIQLNFPTQLTPVSNTNPTIPSALSSLSLSTLSSTLTSIDPCLLNAAQLFNSTQQLCQLQLTPTSTFSPALTTSICHTQGCQQQLYTAFNTAANCNPNSNNPVLPATSSISFMNAASFIQGACVTDSSNDLCVPQVLELSTSIFTNSTAQSGNSGLNSMLDRLCNSQCNTVLSTTSAIAANPSTSSLSASLRMFCVRDQSTTHYCYPNLQTLGLLSAPSTTSTMPPTSSLQFPITPTSLQTLCVPCVKQMLLMNNQLVQQPGGLPSTSTSTTSPLTQLDTLLNTLCAYDGQGAGGSSNLPSMCGTRLLSFNQSFMSLLSTQPLQVSSCLSTIQTQCTSQCNNMLSPLFEQLGCCAGQIVNTPSALASLGLTINQLSLPALQQCGIQTSSCVASNTVVATLTFPNLNSTFVTANKAAVSQSLLADISSATGVPASQITITSIQPINGAAAAAAGTGAGTMVQFSIPSYTAADLTSITTGLNNINSGSIPLQSLSVNLPMSSRLQLSASQSASVVQSTSNTQPASNSTSDAYTLSTIQNNNHLLESTILVGAVFSFIVSIL